MHQFKDKHEGACVIIGNGPSLRFVADSFLHKYPTFGTNRVYLRFIPTYYVCVNPLVLAQFHDDIQDLPCPKFTTGDIGYSLQDCGRPLFSFEPDRYIYEGYTVTYACMQLAYWMGFRTALLAGVDHKYTYAGKPNEERRLEGDDPNHFDPAYFKGMKWNNPDLVKSEAAYKLAAAVPGFRIINLTEGSALDVFERGKVEDW
jgi:hypothetical protein